MLNERNRRFCVEYVKCGNQTEAYRTVYGTSDTVSKANAAKLMKKPEVREYIEKLNKKQEERRILSLEDCLRILTEIAEDPTSSKNERMKAIDMRMKTLGVYLQRMQIEDSSINIKIDTGDNDDS